MCIYIYIYILLLIVELIVFGLCLCFLDYCLFIVDVMIFSCCLCFLVDYLVHVFCSYVLYVNWIVYTSRCVRVILAHVSFK